jgi:hypothetical protein
MWGNEKAWQCSSFFLLSCLSHDVRTTNKRI